MLTDKQRIKNKEQVNVSITESTLSSSSVDNRGSWPIGRYTEGRMVPRERGIVWRERWFGEGRIVQRDTNGMER